ncbi:hypothetical protein Tco_1473622 [Tanacetum coccineum]
MPGTLDQINHNDDDDGDEATAEMVTVMTTAAMAAMVAMMMEMTVAVVRRWRRWRWWRMSARGDGDGVAVIDQAVAWLSAVVTRTVVVARGISGGRRKYSPKKFFGGGWPEFSTGF